MKNDNIWVVTLAVIALVGIVAVFGMTNITGQMIGVERAEIRGEEVPMHALNAQLNQLEVQAESYMSRYDVDIVFVRSRTGTTATIGAIALNDDGTLNIEATDVLNNYLEENAPWGVYVISAEQTLDSIMVSEAGQIMGIGVGAEVQ